MRKLLLFFCFCSIAFVRAQSPSFPNHINYQAVLRDVNGVVLPSGTSGVLNFKVYDNLITTIISYEENHSFTVNAVGVVNLKLGNGAPVGANTFSGTINWQGGEVSYEVYLNSNLISPRQSFATVPYAIYAKNSGGPQLNLGALDQTLYWNDGTKKWTPTSNLSNNGTNVSIGAPPSVYGKLQAFSGNLADSAAIFATKFNAKGKDAGLRSVGSGTINAGLPIRDQSIFGIDGYGVNYGNGSAIGVSGIAQAGSYAYGVTGVAAVNSASGTAIGLYGAVSGPVNMNTWAGYLDGNVFIKDSLFLGGGSNSGTVGDVLALTSTGRAKWKTLSGSSTISLFSNGISVVTPSGPATSFTINTPSPLFSTSGIGNISGVYPNYMLNIPSPSLTIVNNSITITQGPSSVTQTISALTGNGTVGYLPMYSSASSMSISNVFRNAFNNRIGINTNAPSSMLHLLKPAGADTLLLESQSATLGMGLAFKQQANRYAISINGPRLIIDENGIQRMTFANGNVGIGVAALSASDKLQVESTSATDISIVSSPSDQSALNFGTTTNHYLGRVVYQNSSNLLGFWTNNTPNRMVINGNGDVGIGTTIPSQRLDIQGYLRIGVGSGSSNEGFLIMSPSPGLSILQTGGRATNEFRISQTNDAFMTLLTNNSERVRITSDGKVGIATAAPSASLDVNGTFKLGPNGNSLSKIFAGQIMPFINTIAANTNSPQNLTLTGAAVGDRVVVTLGGSTSPTVVLVSAAITAANVLSVNFFNFGASSSAGGTYTINYVIYR